MEERPPGRQPRLHRAVARDELGAGLAGGDRGGGLAPRRPDGPASLAVLGGGDDRRTGSRFLGRLSVASHDAHVAADVALPSDSPQ